MNRLKTILLALGLVAGTTHAQTWVDVWNGTDTAGLYQFGSGTVTFDSGVIHTSGGNGYLATRAEYTHYRARFEWNIKSNNGNSGFLFHILQDRVWPLGLECQTGLGDAGSLWTTGSRFNTTGTTGNQGGYSPTGPALTQTGTNGTSRNKFARSSNTYLGDNLWNAFEIYVEGDSIEIKINNTVVMRVSQITISGGTPLTSGRIGLQIEGAPVDFRNWQVMDLSGPTALLAPPSSRGSVASGTRLGTSLPGLDVQDLLGRRVRGSEARNGFYMVPHNGTSTGR